MAETGRSAAAASSPGGDGSHGGGRDGGEDCRGRSKRPSASPRASPPRSKRGKIEAEAEASQSKENTAGESSSGAVNAIVTGKPQGSVLERTAALIRDIQGVFPPAPEVTVLYQNLFLDLWACGRALGQLWAETWRRLPLVLHDANLAAAVKIILPVQAEENVGLLDDFTKTISKVLNNHPGPIECLRLDGTACPGADLLRSWVDMLSAKGVHELVLLNLTELQLEFPLSHLRSRRLTTLALGFFGLAALSIDWCDHGPSLQQLNLAGCSFSGQDLSMVICRLPHLSSLTIGCCDVTAGCGRQGLTINSRSLTRLYLWMCTASAVTIVNAPALRVLIAGVTSAPAPGRAASAAVLIDLRSVQALQEMHQLALHFHILQIRSDATVKFNCRWVVSLPWLKTLEVHIDVCVPRQAPVLVDLLGHLPRLQKLILWRVDDLSAGDDDEACRNAWSLDLVPPCMRDRLEHLTIRQYRGGGGEVALVRRVMSAARSLLSVTRCPHHTVPLETAAAPFDGCAVASRDCELVVRLHES